jgi:fatty acid desaturase
MGRSVLVALAGLAGLLCAAAIGYAAYAVSRGSVAVPVTRLQPTPTGLTPARVERNRPRRVTTTVATTTEEGHHRGHGGDDSGHGGGGGDD